MVAVGQIHVPRAVFAGGADGLLVLLPGHVPVFLRMVSLNPAVGDDRDGLEVFPLSGIEPAACVFARLEGVEEFGEAVAENIRTVADHVIQVEIVFVCLAGIQFRPGQREVDALDVVFLAEAHQRLVVIQKAGDGEIMHRQVRIDEHQQLGVVLRHQIAVFQQHLFGTREQVVIIPGVFADDLLADGLFGAVFRVVAHKAAS